jgi:hypothetical protein
MRIGLAVLGRPGLWPTAWAQARRLVPAGWWRRAPFLPVPTSAYLDMRLVTQYGSQDHPVEPRDVVHYLTWCRSWERALR